eukprot:m51a1_g1218 putative domain-containing protein (954) ;mRNA; f:492267-495704
MMKRRPGTTDRSEREGKVKFGSLERHKRNPSSLVRHDATASDASSASLLATAPLSIAQGSPLVLGTSSLSTATLMQAAAGVAPLKLDRAWRPPPAPEASAATLPALFGTAKALERTFVEQLDTMLAEYAAPLRASAGGRAGDIDAIFREVDKLRTAAAGALGELEAAAAKGPGSWLGAVYGPSYINVYRTFLSVNKESLSRLGIFRSSPGAAEALARLAKASRFPMLQLEDLMWAAVSRVRHVLSISKCQRDLVVASDIANHCVINAALFHKRKPEDGRTTDIDLDNLELVDESLAMLGELVAEASQIEPLYISIDILRSTEDTARVPPGLGRKFLQQADFSLLSSAEFGLSVELPVKLILFTDALAVVLPLPPEGKFKYRLLEWYELATMHIAEKNTAERDSLIIANKIMSRKGTLPPGWEEAKGRYFYAPLPGSDGDEPPEVMPLSGLKQFSSPPEQHRYWIAVLCSKCGNIEAQPDLQGVPYKVTGTLLERLMSYEESLFANHRIPMIVRRIIYHITSFGLVENNLLLEKPDADVIRDLEIKVNRGELEKLSDYRATDLAAFLKLFLQRLPVPLIPQDVQGLFLNAVRKDGMQQAQALFEAFEALPRHQRNLLREILAFTACVSANSHLNHMTPEKISGEIAAIVVLGATVADTRKIASAVELFTTLIVKYVELFETPESPLFPELLVTDFISFRCTVRDSFWMGNEEGICIYNTDVKTPYSLKCKNILSLAYEEAHDEVWCGTPSAIIIFDRETKERVADLREPQAAAGERTETWAIAAAQNGQVWSGGRKKNAEQQEIRVWDRVDGLITTVQRIPSQSSRKITVIAAVGPDTMWTAYDDGTIAVWNTFSYTLVTKLARHKGSVLGLAVLSSGQVWSCSEDQKVMIWEAKSYRCVGEVRGYHTDKLGAIVAVENRETHHANVWAGSYDSTISVWSARPIPAYCEPLAAF